MGGNSLWIFLCIIIILHLAFAMQICNMYVGAFDVVMFNTYYVVHVYCQWREPVDVVLRLKLNITFHYHNMFVINSRQKVNIEHWIHPFTFEIQIAFLVFFIRTIKPVYTIQRTVSGTVNAFMVRLNWWTNYLNSLHCSSFLNYFHFIMLMHALRGNCVFEIVKARSRC